MEIVAFTVSNYRSIQRAERLELSQRTVLVGPNNEGKSNLLRALSTSVRYLCTAGDDYQFEDWSYSWRKDYPIGLQEVNPKGFSTFGLDFRLTEEERRDFRDRVGSRINDLLPVRIKWGRGRPSMEVLKQGPGKQVLSNNAEKIRDFMSRHLRIETIPAVRTAAEAHRVAQEIIGAELARAEQSPAYKAAIEAIADLQRPIFRRLTRNLTSSLREFLPDIRSVDISASRAARQRALRETYTIRVDDGTATELRFKGDGVQSLAALALMKHAATPKDGSGALFLAIEEPESHLHPSAIHRLGAVINEISKKHQVVLTTHCPLFVDRHHIEANIVVNQNKAKPAASIQAIRAALGVRVSDNLHNADIILIAEGEEDRMSLLALLRHHSKRLKSAIDSGTLAVDSLGGSSKLTYKLQLVRDSLCQTVVLLDNDAAGRQAAANAVTDGLLRASDRFYTTARGTKDAEFEDMLDSRLYSDLITDLIGQPLVDPIAAEAKYKWSDRICRIAARMGKLIDEPDIRALKMRIARMVAAHPENALKLGPGRGPFDSLVQELETRIDGLPK